MDEMIEFEKINHLLANRKITKHIYVFDIYPLKLISPIEWKDGLLMKCLGYGDYLEEDEPMTTAICNVIMERCVEIVMSETNFHHFLDDPITLKEELIYYLNETHRLTAMYENSGLMEYEADVIREYLHYFSKYLTRITNGIVDRAYNILDARYGTTKTHIVNGSFYITSCNIDVSGTMSSSMIIEKYFNIPALP